MTLYFIFLQQWGCKLINKKYVTLTLSNYLSDIVRLPVILFYNNLTLSHYYLILLATSKFSLRYLKPCTAASGYVSFSLVKPGTGTMHLRRTM